MGGAEPTLYRGSVWFTPIIEEWYYQVEVLKLEVGSQNLDLDCREVRFSDNFLVPGFFVSPSPVRLRDKKTKVCFFFLSFLQYNMDKAIVDSGTTLLRLPVNVFNAVVEAITRSSLVRHTFLQQMRMKHVVRQKKDTVTVQGRTVRDTELKETLTK